jgi:hypothetical protein
MAVATGTQIRPELSAVDYTPFLQAAGQSAQMQAQGIAALGAGALKGFESYVQQTKENKQLEAEVKSAEKLGQALQPFLAQINPEAGARVNTLLSSVADPNISLRERSAVAKNIGSALNNILNLAQLGKQTQDQKAAAEYAAMLRTGGGAIPSPVSPAALAKFSPEQAAAGESAYLQQARQAAELAKTRAETVSLLSPKAKEAPSGFRFTKDGNLEEIPGGPAAVAREREAEQSRLAKAAADRQEKELKLRLDEASARATSEVEKKRIADEALKSAAEDARLSADTTLREIDKARSLIDKPFAQGFGSSIGGFFSGSAANDLETSYDVIRSNEALSRIIALKKVSPTGSTGFGALNLKELETLQSRFAKLTRSASDVAAKEALNDLERIIGKAFPDARAQIEAESKAKVGTARPSAPMSPTQVKAGSRFEIVSTSP